MTAHNNETCKSTQHKSDYRLRIKNRKVLVKTALIALVTLNLFKLANASENGTNSIFNKLNIAGIKKIGRSFFSDVYNNGTFVTGNALWDNILNQCTEKPTVSCLQKNVYSYLDERLGFNGDIKVAKGVCFNKNSVDINRYSREANLISDAGSRDKEEEKGRYLDEENEIGDDNDEPETPLEEVTDALYSKAVKFLVTHDMKLALPEIFFHGSTLKVSPRALTKTGALVHIEIEPKEETNGQGRLFFHKIKKYIKKKLVLAALAIILVVKLIALKLIFVLPVILGVSTAKKMFLKLLLFLFPALSHIFKLCSWYHQSYQSTKYHHHHLIHHNRPQHPGIYGGHHPPQHHHGGAIVVQPHSAPPQSGGFEHYPQDWELSGPGLGNEYIASDIHRNAILNFKPNPTDGNDIKAWGLGLPPGPSANVGEYGAPTNNQPNVVAGPNGRPVGRPVGPHSQSQFNRNKKYVNKDPAQAEKEALIRAASLAARAPPSPVRDEVLRVSAAKLSETNRVEQETELVRQQQKIIAAMDPETQAAEKFYGNLLDRVNNVLGQIGANDMGCQERAICSLYKDPFSHTPYSNLVSNELSKDSSELLPAADSKMAVRYYRYVQAARDGQEQKECLSQYPHCNLDYTKKKK